MKRVIRFQMEGKTYQVLVDRSGDELTVEGEGQRYRVSLLREAVGGPAAASGPGVSAPAVVTPAASPSNTPAAASMPGGAVAGAAPTPSAPGNGGVSSAPGAGGDPGALLAPMTGVIKEIRVSVGHNVQKGQVVLVMEAMKMDVEVPSPIAGVVVEVSVRAGDTVSARQQLLVVH